MLLLNEKEGVRDIFPDHNANIFISMNNYVRGEKSVGDFRRLALEIVQ